MIKLNEKNKKIIKNILIAVFLIYIFGLCFSMAITTDYNTGPDERMKYDVCRYIYNNSELPHGGDESIRDSIWGISYAFTPILSYMISAVFMRVFDVIANDGFSLLIFARMVSVICITAYAFMCIKISKKLFKDEIYRWVFVAFSTLLPQLLYLGTYINNDSLALLSITLIVYAWLIGLETNWNWKSCIMLSVGIGICALAYYNAYGYILCSVIIYFASAIIKKMDIKEFLKKGLTIAGIAILIAGWWFIRNAIIYDGDFIGLNVSREYGEMYAQERFKPSNRTTPNNQGMTLSQMLYKQNNWIESTIRSFIGQFGHMTVIMDENIYDIYHIVGIVGIIGLVIGLIELIKNKIEKKKDNNMCKEKILLNIIMFINIIIPIGLSIYYSYFNDYQPQGRYVMPIIIPFMYFLTIGIKKICDWSLRKEAKNVILTIFMLILAIMAGYISIVYVIKPL